MSNEKATVEEQAEEALRSGEPFDLECALRRALVEIPEHCAKRVETYAVSLEMQRHIGLPDPVEALTLAAEKVRKLAWAPSRTS
jgi:hypothetical protein